MTDARGGSPWVRLAGSPPVVAALAEIVLTDRLLQE
jgi:hypothetical protein